MSVHRWDPVCPEPRGLVRPVPVDPEGRQGPTKRQAAGPRWRRTSQGLYVPAHVNGTRPEQRILEESRRLPPDGVVTGWAACRLHRATFFDGFGGDGETVLPVPVRVAPGTGPRSGDRLVVTHQPLDDDEVVVRSGVRVTVPIRATFDAMRLAPDVVEATVALDMMCAARLVSIARVAAYAAARPGARGVRQVRSALDLASEHARSPNEVRLRLVCQLDAGLTVLLVNCPVLTRSGRLLGIADLLDPVAGLVVEYDGADHRAARRHSRDVGRDADFRDHGLEVTRVTGPDLRDSNRVTDRVLRARSRSRFEPGADRRWLPVPPRPVLDELLTLRDLTEGA